MKGLAQCVTVFSLSALSSVSVAKAITQDSSQSALTVKVYNLTGEPAAVVERATVLASRILSQAGIPSVWLSCGEENGNWVADKRCLAKSGILMRLVPGGSKTIQGTSDATLGYALVPAKGHGYVVGVVMDHVSQYVDRLGVPPDAVLGYVMAHEVGHILLGHSQHSRRGIMRSVWDAEEVLRAWSRPALFSAKEAERIRRNLETRLSLRK